ncbi:MAG: twin-arginine translocase subunit TatC [Deltaproteobacteria bacterium]|nr:twin-arginine translocase subunit TatC [Deltaproteobacteria bacterium]MBW1918903.1 twin-arginine translocase subunit TatC [Deltaproteobacteria bacterium]MBW1934717.1 twin-arginine translocase subunit TatC [Deltaproteobacteria bacterium]MBW1976964.1 twin-arginine translocase subunit TatC [Deltaproteobacteria bacterium]MBW2044688.1 twin-arginine translocase subunit TatC [Deltaproteobacteria bacterium]
MNSDEKQPFMAHLEELRSRLIACAIAVGIGFGISYVFSKKLFLILILPLKANMPAGDKLIFTNLPEMFFTYLKTAFIAGILLSSPFIFYEIWMFIAPGLYQKERKFLIPFVVFSSILFVGGALFGYFVVFPFGFKFFLSFANEYIQALPSVKQYFSFAIKLLLAFGVVFELPVVAFFLAKMGLVTSKFLKRQRKFAILLIFVTAAILTPPDMVTQLMMAGPLLLLYEISIYVAKIAERKKAPKEEVAEEGA